MHMQTYAWENEWYIYIFVCTKLYKHTHMNKVMQDDCLQQCVTLERNEFSAVALQ